jgi:hypothetical protein
MVDLTDNTAPPFDRQTIDMELGVANADRDAAPRIQAEVVRAVIFAR